MLYNIFLFISIIIISHFLWNYIKDTFTVKKKIYNNKDIDKYRQLLDEQFSNNNKSEPEPEFEMPMVSFQHDLELFLENNI